MEIGYTARAILFYSYLRQQSSKIVTVTELAELLETSKPNISQILQQLREIGYVENEKYKPLKLTNNGFLKSEVLYYKILVIESFLFKALAMPFYKCRAEAFSWEHEIFDTTLDKIIAKTQIIMGLTGDEIPTTYQNKPIEKSVKLCKRLSIGDQFKICAYKTLDLMDSSFLTELSSIYLENAVMIGVDNQTETYVILCNNKKVLLPETIIDNMVVYPY